MIEVISPAGFEHFFRELTGLTAAGLAQFPDVLALADRYGLHFGHRDRLPELVSHYGLTPPPGA